MNDSRCVLPALAVVIALGASMAAAADQAVTTAERDPVTGAHATKRRALVLRERRAYYAPLIEEAARTHCIRVELVHAIIEVESAYRSAAVSSAGAVGLMQLMPRTAQRYGVYDSTDPRQNLAGGTAYLRDLDALYDGDLRLILGAYNAGEEAVARYGDRVPPFRETQAYVRRVTELLRRRSTMLVSLP